MYYRQEKAAWNATVEVASVGLFRPPEEDQAGEWGRAGEK